MSWTCPAYHVWVSPKAQTPGGGARAAVSARGEGAQTRLGLGWTLRKDGEIYKESWLFMLFVEYLMAIWWVFNGYLMGFFHRNLVGMSASMAILCLVGAKKEEFRYYGIFIAFVQIHEILGNIVLPTMRWNDVSYFWDKSIWWDWGLVSTKHNLIIYYNYNMAMGSNTFFWHCPGLIATGQPQNWLHQDLLIENHSGNMLG